ncbi:MAG TPA: BamA/TamA family outer membrane protein [Polyangia bacterium]|nr:BamA/TamA family outer membrane protein [Polyangia bacterium]
MAFAPRRALAFGETITDVRILDNQRTDEATVRSIAGISPHDTLEVDTLDTVRERLNTSGLFADVNVWWEPHGEGVRVNVSVKDKFPWAPVPTASFSANNKSFGLLFVHGNLFGRGKQLLIGGRLATVDSGAVIGYRDPAFFGSWIYWGASAWVQNQVIPEYDSTVNGSQGDPLLLRETHLFGYGIEPNVGIAWFRRVKTQFAWRFEHFTENGSYEPMGDTSSPTTAATAGGMVGVARGSLTFDFRAREFAVMRGVALYLGLDVANPTFHSDFDYWRAGVSWEHGIRVFRQHNFVYYVGANTGHDLPFWAEQTGGGTNLRGYLFQQFRGDSAAFGKVEYHFPLFSISSLDFRGLVFYDTAAVWYREDPTGGLPAVPNPTSGQSYYLRATADQRTFPTSIEQGLHRDNFHNDVGGGLRFFLRSVAVPLVGFDAGYGLEAKNWRFILIVGA